MAIAKKYKAAVALFDRDAQYTPTEAIDIVKKTASAKFDESVDVAIRLGVDPRKADQNVRGTVALPAGSGKTLRIAVVAAGDAAAEARAAGADSVCSVTRNGWYAVTVIEFYCGDSSQGFVHK